MLEFMKFLTKEYPNFHIIGSNNILENIYNQFDPIFNEENKEKILIKKQNLLNKGYTEILYRNKISDYIEYFYNNPLYIKIYYLDIELNKIDKQFIIYKIKK